MIDSAELPRHGTGVALTNKGAPEVGVGILLFERQLRLPQRLGSRLTSKQSPVEVSHQFLGLLVGHLPQTHHQRLGSGQHESPAQAEDPFSYLHRSQARLTG